MNYFVSFFGFFWRNTTLTCWHRTRSRSAINIFPFSSCQAAYAVKQPQSMATPVTANLVSVASSGRGACSRGGVSNNAVVMEHPPVTSWIDVDTLAILGPLGPRWVFDRPSRNRHGLGESCQKLEGQAQSITLAISCLQHLMTMTTTWLMRFVQVSLYTTYIPRSQMPSGNLTEQWIMG